jgi:photosystem II stability/assembly factor-like uncharacterized protein
MRPMRIVLSLLLATGVGLAHPAVAGDDSANGTRRGAILEGGAVEPGESESEESEDGVRARDELYLRQHGELDRVEGLARLQRAREQYARRRTERQALQSKSAAVSRWTSLGPTNGAGRMNSIALHPTLAGTAYAGSAGGGLWKTEDYGASWRPLTDDLSDLIVGAVAVAPSSPDTIYLGTGEANGMPGIGLLVSVDGGANWTLPDTVIAGWFFRISVHPANPQDLAAGTDAGGFRSTDGGRTWSRFLPSSAVTDLVRSPADPNVLYAATLDSAVWRSEDGGSTWMASGSGISAAGVRVSLAMSPSDPHVLFAAAEISGTSHVYKSVDGGRSWADLDSVCSNSDAQHFMGTLGDYANTIVVLPGEPETVVAGGVAAIRSTNGGASWTPLPGTHADFHDLQYQGSTLWLANDGGVWTSADGGVTVVDRNAGLVTRQYYSLAGDLSSPDRILAGAQDNGTSLRSTDGGADWRPVGAGDGFDCAIDPQTPGVLYTSEPYGTLYRLIDTGTNAAPTVITPPYEEDESRPFHTVLVLDPQRPATIYTGSTRVWRSIDGGGSWLALPTGSSDSWTGDEVTTIAVAPSDPLVVMVGKGARVYRSNDGGQTWLEADDGLPDADVNRIAVDPTNAAIAYAALATAAGASLYATVDGSAHWQSRALGLPASAALVVRIDPTDPKVLYCGTDAGVFRSTDRGANWSLFGADLPATSVQDLQVSGDGSTIRIATYGRGIWELRASQPTSARGSPSVPCSNDPAGCPGTRSPRIVPPRG